MRVRVIYTVDVDDDYRRAIRHYHGETGLAERWEVRDFLMLHGSSLDDDIMRDLPDEEEVRDT